MPSHAFPLVQVSFPHFYSHSHLWDRISLSEFVGSEAQTYLSVKDILNPHTSVVGTSNSNQVRIGVPSNKNISVQDYMRFVNSSKVNYAVSLAEEAPLSAGHHRARRSSIFAVAMLDQCLKLKNSNTKILGNIQGGSDLAIRGKCAREMKKREVDGFVIGGLSEQDHGAKVRRLVESVCYELKEDSRMIVLGGLGRPLDVVHGASQGVTHFEVAWPFLKAKEGIALNLGLESFEDEGELVDEEFWEPELNLSHKRFAQAKGPLVEGCECFTCTHHHRAYVHHLLGLNELNAHTLLAEHNTYCYQKLITLLNSAKEEGNLKKVYPGFVKKYCEMKVSH